MENIKVIVDSRERNQELIFRLEETGCSLIIETLDIGDYLLSDRIAVERKTVSDFEGSIMDGRLFDQLERIKRSFESPILLIEGSRKEFRLGKNVILGTIASIYTDFNILVVRTAGPKESADIMARIANREQHEKVRSPSPKAGARAVTHEGFQMNVIGNIPGVGPKLAESLLKRFGSIRNIANATVEELMAIEKIGEKKALQIHRTLNLSYNVQEEKELVS
jgi:Fanconi anemia group M protein